MKTIGEKIREARTQELMSQLDLAYAVQELGGKLSQASLSRLEQGEHIPLASTLELIAVALGREIQLVKSDN